MAAHAGALLIVLGAVCLPASAHVPRPPPVAAKPHPRPGCQVRAARTNPGAGLPAPWGANAASSGASTLAYDAATATATDPAGVARSEAVDAAGRLAEVVEDPGAGGLQHATAYAHDALDRLTGVTQGAQARSFTHSSLGLLVRAANVERDAVAYTYDANGQLESRTDTRNTLTLARDGLGRVTRTAYTGRDATPTVVHCHDGMASTGGRACVAAVPAVAHARGRLTSVSSTASTTQITGYDALGRVTASAQATGGRTYAFAYGYDAAGNLTSMTYPASGRVVTWEHDGAGRPTLARDGAAGTAYHASGVEYAPHGAVAALKLGNGLWESASYNARLQPTEVRLGAASGAGGLWRLAIGYGAGGNSGSVRAQTLTVPGAAAVWFGYGYDALGRLAVAAERPAEAAAPACPDAGSLWCHRYDHDRWGNRLVGARTGEAAGLLEPAGFDAATNRVSGGAWLHDAGGRVVRDALNAGYLYDAEGRQVAYCPAAPAGCPAGNGGARTTYEYDGEGRRVRVAEPGRTTVFAYDAFGLLAGEFVVAGAPPEGLPQGARYLTADPLGTVRVVTDAGGAVAERRDHRPYGEEALAGAGSWRAQVAGYGRPAGVRLGFTGKERDGETGLDYFGARYYGGAMGRFTTPDAPFADQFPEDPQSWNLYSYVRNNPLRYIDDDGRGAKEFLLGVSNAVSSNAGFTPRIGSSDLDVRLGQRVGDVISFAGGLVEIAAGTLGAGGGGLACGTGAGCVVGASAVAGSVALAGHGAATSGTAAANLFNSSANEATSSGSPYEETPQNQERMKQGKAPVGKDGKPVELHHEGQASKGQLTEMTRTEHRGGDNFKKNHSNTGQQASQVDRSTFRQQREQYWKDKAKQRDQQ